MRSVLMCTSLYRQFSFWHKIETIRIHPYSSAWPQTPKPKIPANIEAKLVTSKSSTLDQALKTAIDEVTTFREEISPRKPAAHVGTNGSLPVEDGKPQEKHWRLVEAETASKEEKAPVKLQYIAAQPTKQNVRFRAEEKSTPMSIPTYI